MGTAAELRKQIESGLAGRIPAALSPRPLRSPELISCGVAEVDALLGGGLPLGSIIELTGVGPSGRSTLALSTLAGLTRRGHCCAYVDACDALDPLSAAAAGVELRRLLWVRPPEALACAHPTFAKDGQIWATRSLPGGPFKPGAPGKPGVPGAPAFGVLGWKPAVGVLGWRPSVGLSGVVAPPHPDPALRLDRALRATDLLLNAGGWSAVVLDLGELPPEQARRVPLATWYRFRLQAEKSRALLLLLTPIACANSCAAISLHGEEIQANWRRAAEDAPAQKGPALLAEMHYRISVVRSRAAGLPPKKPASSHPTSPPQQTNRRAAGDPGRAGADMQGPEQTWWTSTLSWPG